MTRLKVVSIILIIAIFFPPSFELNNGGRIPYTKSRLMLEYNWPKVIKGMKRIPHIVSCDHFYATRLDGSHDIKKCPNGQSFDFESLLCKEKTQAHCWSKRFMPDHTKQNQFVCPFPWGFYPDVEECSKYFSCMNGKAHHRKCPNLSMFDKVSRKCVNESEAMCANEKDIVETGYKCPYTWGYFTYSKDCSKYYECLHKNPSLRTCKRNMLFDNFKRKCLPMSSVDCGNRYNPYEQVQSSSIKSDSTAFDSLSTSTAFDSLSTSRPTQNGENPTESISSQRDEYSTGQTATDFHSTQNEENPTVSSKDEYSTQQTAGLHSTQNDENPTIDHKDEYSTGRNATYLHSTENKDNTNISYKDEYSGKQTSLRHSTQNEEKPTVSRKDEFSTRKTVIDLHPTQTKENPSVSHKYEYSTEQTSADLHSTKSHLVASVGTQINNAETTLTKTADEISKGPTYTGTNPKLQDNEKGTTIVIISKS